MVLEDEASKLATSQFLVDVGDAILGGGDERVSSRGVEAFRRPKEKLREGEDRAWA